MRVWDVCAIGETKREKNTSLFMLAVPVLSCLARCRVAHFDARFFLDYFFH
jgi:hypothetical protein